MTPGLAPVSSIRRSRVSSPSKRALLDLQQRLLRRAGQVGDQRAPGLLDLGLQRAALVLGRDHGKAHARHHQQADDERAEFDLERSQEGPAVAEDSEPRGDAVDGRRRQAPGRVGGEATGDGSAPQPKRISMHLEDRERPWGRAR